MEFSLFRRIKLHRLLTANMPAVNSMNIRCWPSKISENASPTLAMNMQTEHSSLQWHYCGSVKTCECWVYRSHDKPNTDMKRSSRRQISEGISAVITGSIVVKTLELITAQILQTCGRLGYQSGLYRMIAKAWRPASHWHTTPKPNSERSNRLKYIIIEMQKFKALSKEEEPDNDTWKQLRLLIALAEDLTKLDSSTPADKQFERIRLLRDCNLWFPLNSLLTAKSLSSTLMVNAYLYTIALYAQRRTSQAYMIDLGVDLPNLLEETLRQVRPMKSYIGSLNSLKAFVSSI